MLDSHMSGGQWTVVLVATALVVMAWASMGVPGVARVLLITQTFYWAWSYVARPVVLLWVQPVPQYDDSLADPRLAGIGYDHGISLAMKPVVFGLWVYAVLVMVLALWCRGRRSPEAKLLRDNRFIPTMWLIYALGTASRVGQFVTGTTGGAGDIKSPNAILEYLAFMASTGALAIIIYLRSPARVTTVFVLTALVAGEVLWSAVTESKAPVMGAALAVAVRFAIIGWNRARVAGVTVIAVLGITMFPWLQSFKHRTAGSSIDAAIDQSYPPHVRFLLPMLRRFDLLDASTDVYYMNGRPWIVPSEVIHHAVESLIPAQLLGREKFAAGVRWATEVRGSSVDMSNVTVSLAEGHINEGYLVGGYVGVVITSIFLLGMVLAWSGALFSRSIFVVALAVEAGIASPILFERGIMGNFEVIGKCLQIAALVAFIYFCVGKVRRMSGQGYGFIPIVEFETEMRARR